MALAFVFSAASAEELTIAGGGGVKQGSVYSKVISDFASVCTTENMPLREVNSSGSIENLELLRANKVKAATLQADILFAARMQNAASVANIKTVFALHPEDVLLVARADQKTEGGVSLGKFNVGGTKVAYNVPEDLKDRVVGAVGGSAVTSQILSDLLRIQWFTKGYKSNTDLLTALDAGEIDAAMMVAGSQSPAVLAIPAGRFKLLPLRGNSETSTIYTPRKVSYQNLERGRAVDTLSTQALLVTRVWRSDDMLNQLATLRACLKKNVGVIADTTGSHSSWQDIDGTSQGLWTWYDLPSASQVQQPVQVQQPQPRKK